MIQQIYNILTSPKGLSMSGDRSDINSLYRILQEASDHRFDFWRGYIIGTGSAINLGVYLKEAPEKLVGVVRLETLGPSTPPSEVPVVAEVMKVLDKDLTKWNRVGRLHYFFDAEIWGKGIATESLQRVTRYAFEDLKIEALYGKAISSNPASLRVMEKAGYQAAENGSGFSRWSAGRGTREFSYRFLDYNQYQKVYGPLAEPRGSAIEDLEKSGAAQQSKWDKKNPHYFPQ